jgi:hypothetical protein
MITAENDSNEILTQIIGLTCSGQTGRIHRADFDVWGLAEESEHGISHAVNAAPASHTSRGALLTSVLIIGLCQNVNSRPKSVNCCN